MDAFEVIEARIARAEDRYGPLASTHEAMGVMLEEWDELRLAVHENALGAVAHEALDLAAICIRLARAIDGEEPQLMARSVK